MLKGKGIYLKLIFILVLVVAAVFVCFPNGPYLKIGNKVIFKKEIKIKEGLDLQGGARVVYSADLSKIEDSAKNDAMKSLANVIEKRINAFGVAEPTVVTANVAGENRLVVEMPGVKDVNEAIKLIGKTAELDFRTMKADQSDYEKTDLTGKDFKRAEVTFDQSGKPQISIQFNSDGAKKFEKITGENVGKPLAIYLDNELISAPNVNEKITGGQAVITGKFDIKEAKNLAIQLNAGALPVPIKMIEQRTVGATLGQESVRMSVYAGVIGIIVVSLFMIVYYRFLGVLSTIGLGLYIVFSLAAIKVFPPSGITLTMGGIAGLILSVGMSMETDVLVFERIREELRDGKTFDTAVKLGFKKAWTSIRDSNAVSVIIAMLLLLNVGGTIRGFALVLILGIVIGLATTFWGTQTLLRIFIRFKLFKKYSLFSVEESLGETK